MSTPLWSHAAPANIVMMTGDHPDAATELRPKWSSVQHLLPEVGDMVTVRRVWGDGKPLGKGTVVGYMVERGWLYLAVAPARRYWGPAFGAIAFVAGTDLAVPATRKGV